MLRQKSQTTLFEVITNNGRLAKSCRSCLSILVLQKILLGFFVIFLQWRTKTNIRHCPYNVKH